MAGLYDKYKIEKADGKPIDPKAKYFVLRIDTDIHARVALRAYRDSLLRNGENEALCYDLDRLLQEYPD